MSIKEKDFINVLNYNTNVVAISTKNDSYLMQPSDGDNPSVLPLTPSEIEYINGSSSAFKSGTLRFPEEIEEEVYTKLLRIFNWKDIITNKEIREIILKPTIEGLQKIINIKNSLVFERVRGIFINLKNTGNEDVSTRIEKIITTRYRELCSKQINSSIIIQTKDTSSSDIPSSEVLTLKEQNKNMKLQMEQMQKMMEQMMEMQKQNSKNDSKSKSDIATKEKTKNTKKEKTNNSDKKSKKS